MQEKIKEIRTRLRLGMNGVVSQSMREKGVVYKLNFGLLIPQIREIAASFEKESALAAALWKEDIREFKILATLLQPEDEYTWDDALRWISQIPYQEIAEQLCFNLLKKLSYAEELAWHCFFREEGYFRTVAFLVAAHLCRAGHSMEERTAYALLGTGRYVMDQGVSSAQRAALLAWKQYGRQSPGQAAQVLSLAAGYKDCGYPDREEFYNDLKFEFDYYR